MEKTKSERGYTSAGRMITRILSTVSDIYPLNSRFVNTEEWNDPGQLYLMMFCLTYIIAEFSKQHAVYWGRLYEAQDVVIEWHGKLFFAVKSNEI